MFFAEPVRLYNIITIKEVFSLLTKKMLDFGAVHIEENLPLIDMNELSSFESQDLIGKLDSLQLRIESLGKILGFDIEDLGKANVDPFLKFPDDGLDFQKGIGALEDKIMEWEHIITQLASLLEEKKDFIFLHEQISWFFSLLIHSGIESLYELDDLFLCWRFGNMPRDNINTLQQALSEIPFSMEFANISRNRCVVLIVTLPEYGKNLDAALHAAGFIEVNLPDISLTSVLSDFEDDMEFSLWEARDEIAQIKGRLSKLSEEYYTRLGGALKLIRMYKNVLNSLLCVKKTDSVVALNVWVLQKDIVDFENMLASRFRGSIYYESVSVESLSLSEEKIPAKFDVKNFLRPFFNIVEMFGYPSYGEVNPMIFVFVNMILMFGVMFADVGHGAILILLGISFFKVFENLGFLFIPLGLSSLFFGFVFGSVFGSENIIKPLWVVPLKGPLKIIGLSIIIGIVDIMLAIFLNLLLSVRRRNWHEFWTGQWGVFALIAYVLMLSLFIPVVHMPVYLKLVLFFTALFLPVVLEAYQNKQHKKSIDISLFIFHPFETFISLFSNTISYVRIAAFNFNHAALMMVVFVLADLVSFEGRFYVIKILMLILGNVFVVGLETVLSSIQCLRLNYYEFFTKFYKGNGRKFVPLKWI